MRPVTVPDSGVLRWPSRVLSAIELERVRGKVREILVPPRTIITPSAAEWLRANGAVVTEDEPAAAATDGGWRCAQEWPVPGVNAALAGLTREGLSFADWPGANGEPLARWVRWLAEDVASGNGPGAVVFCHDAMLAACVANKVAAVRGAAVANTDQARAALRGFAANWLAVTVPGPTFFEIRHILRTVATTPVRECPEAVADVLAELQRRG